MQPVRAHYYDGQSARRHEVTLEVHSGVLHVHGEGVQFEVPISSVHLSEKLGSAPRLMHFPEGGHCEVVDHRSLEQMLLEAGRKPHSLVSRLEASWRHAFIALSVCVLTAVVGYIWGVPWVAEYAAERIPNDIAHIIDEHVLNSLDEKIMQPSELKEKRKKAIERGYDKLRAGHGLPNYPLEFRKSALIGPNAFALPGGSVVVTDELVKLAGKNDEVLAVLAHELGHVEEHHALRQMLQSSVVALAMTWYFGDVSSLLVTAPTLMLQMNYSRDFERRADNFAARLLHDHGKSPALLASMLEKLENIHSKKLKSKEQPVIIEMMSSHPETQERIRLMREWKK